MILRYLIEKEFKQILRHSFLPKLIFIFPCMVMLVFPWAATMEVKHIKVAVVDNDHSGYSRKLTGKVQFSEFFDLTGFHPSYQDALEEIRAQRADVVLEISPGFERDIIRQGQGQVMISTNTVNGVKGGLASMYLSSIVGEAAREIEQEAGPWLPQQPAPQIRVLTDNRFNRYMDYKVFMVPALMAMILTLLCGFLPALNIVGEKEAGTIEQINVSPVGKGTFILAKLIPYWAIGFLILTLCFGIALLVYGLPPSGSVGTIYLFAALFMLTISGLGLVVSNNSSAMQQAMLVMFFFIMLFLLMSGLFTPVESMPAWAQAITAVNPLKYFMRVLRMVYLKGSGLGQLMPELATLSALAAAVNAWAILSFRKNK